jgi:hypothetical protein
VNNEKVLINKKMKELLESNGYINCLRLFKRIGLRNYLIHYSDDQIVHKNK